MKIPLPAAQNLFRRTVYIRIRQKIPQSCKIPPLICAAGPALTRGAGAPCLAARLRESAASKGLGEMPRLVSLRGSASPCGSCSTAPQACGFRRPTPGPRLVLFRPPRAPVVSLRRSVNRLMAFHFAAPDIATQCAGQVTQAVGFLRPIPKPRLVLLRGLGTLRFPRRLREPSAS